MPRTKANVRILNGIPGVAFLGLEQHGSEQRHDPALFWRLLRSLRSEALGHQVRRVADVRQLQQEASFLCNCRMLENF